MGKTAADWDKAYAGDAPFGDRPCPGLVQAIARLKTPPGKALMLADGDGRNGTWLATRGWTVTAVDYSPIATEHARLRDEAASVAVERIVADLETWSPDGASVALATILFLQLPADLRRRTLSAAIGALAPGGHLVLETFAGAPMPNASLGPPEPVRWQMAETRAWLREIEGVEETEAFEGFARLDDGPRHTGTARILRLLARRVA
ncbi:MAG: class I SAM-dependent methyltransferase [Pseudomonadota bacterium]